MTQTFALIGEFAREVFNPTGLGLRVLSLFRDSRQRSHRRKNYPTVRVDHQLNGSKV